MERNEALGRIQEIQRIMERTTLYTLLPGAPAIIGGFMVLAGCVASYFIIGSVDFTRLLWNSYETQIGFCVMWALIGIAAIVQDIVLTTRIANRHSEMPGGRSSRLAAFSLTPSVFIAIILTIKFMYEADIQYVAPVWMMCYGTGVYAAGLFSLRLPRLLGLAFIGSGAVGLIFLIEYGVLLVAFSFGLMHIIFGLTVIMKRRRSIG